MNGLGRIISMDYLYYFIYAFNFTAGKFFFNNGDRYEGEYSNDKKNGHGMP